MVSKRFKTTQLREYYDALHALKHQEWDALSRLHARDPARLRGRWTHDIQTVADYDLSVDEPFRPKEPTPLPDPPGPGEIRSTPEFAAQLGPGDHHVVGRPDLSFRLINREVSSVPGRVRWLDLLLVNITDAATPVLGELKIGTDKLPYFAFIQLLMHAVELSSVTQHARMREHLGLPDAVDETRVDLYVVGCGKPNVTYHDASLKATCEIAEKLLIGKKACLKDHVRRIAYIEARPQGNSLEFHPEFVVE